MFCGRSEYSLQKHLRNGPEKRIVDGICPLLNVCWPEVNVYLIFGYLIFKNHWM